MILMKSVLPFYWRLPYPLTYENPIKITRSVEPSEREAIDGTYITVMGLETPA